jgi:hypothetical protein
MAQSGRRLTARPAESEHPVTEINHLHPTEVTKKGVFLNYAIK